MLSNPVVVSPSGVTYSQETVDELLSEARRQGTEAKCPVTGQLITGYTENQVVASILARYMFKQQVTGDVMATLKDYQSNSAQTDEDQPLEAYVQQMRAKMAERLDDAHQEQLAKNTAGFTQQLELKSLETQEATSSATKAEVELKKVRAEYEKHKKEANATKLEQESVIAGLREELQALREDNEALKKKSAELVGRVTRLSAQLVTLEEQADDDADAMGAETSNVRVNKVRKAELIRLETEVQRLTEELEGKSETVAKSDDVHMELREEVEAAKRESSAERAKADALAEERDELRKKLDAMQASSS